MLNFIVSLMTSRYQVINGIKSRLTSRTFAMRAMNNVSSIRSLTYTVLTFAIQNGHRRTQIGLSRPTQRYMNQNTCSSIGTHTLYYIRYTIGMDRIRCTQLQFTNAPHKFNSTGSIRPHFLRRPRIFVSTISTFRRRMLIMVYNARGGIVYLMAARKSSVIFVSLLLIAAYYCIWNYSFTMSPDFSRMSMSGDR